jgi:hypothetical protein
MVARWKAIEVDRIANEVAASDVKWPSTAETTPASKGARI